MIRRQEAGQALLFTAIGLVALMGFAGLAVDVGVMRVEKRVQQTAADAAAIAAASNLAYSGWQAGGQAAAVANGFTDSSSNDVASCTASGATVGTICVELDNGPADGPHAGNTSYVEARVAAVRPTYFMQLLGIHSESVTARAVATSVSGGDPAGSGCLYTLGAPSKKGVEGVSVSGSASLLATGCGIVDNGDYDPNDPAVTVEACSFGVAGSDTGNGKANVTCNGQVKNPTYGIPAGPDPLAQLTPPCSPCSGGTALSANGGATFNPGTYTSISLQGNGTVTFNPGVYVIDTSAGFTCHGTPTITGTGVMFYFTNGATINCSGNDTTNLTAPSASNCSSCAAQYDGILMYQDPTDTNGPTLGGNTGTSFDGALYFPSSEVTFFGNATGSGIGVGLVVSKALALSGHPTVTLEGIAGLKNQGITVNDITTAILVE